MIASTTGMNAGLFRMFLSRLARITLTTFSMTSPICS